MTDFDRDPFAASPAVISDDVTAEQAVRDAAVSSALSVGTLLRTTFDLWRGGFVVAFVLLVVDSLIYFAIEWVPVLLGDTGPLYSVLSRGELLLFFSALEPINAAFTVMLVSFFAAAPTNAGGRARLGRALVFRPRQIWRVFLLSLIAIATFVAPAKLALTQIEAQRISWLLLTIPALLAFALLWLLVVLAPASAITVLEDHSLLATYRRVLRLVSGRKLKLAGRALLVFGAYTVIITAQIELVELWLDSLGLDERSSGFASDLIGIPFEAAAGGFLIAYYVALYRALTAETPPR